MPLPPPQTRPAPDAAVCRALLRRGDPDSIAAALGLVAKRIEGDLHLSGEGADRIAARAVKPFLTKGDFLPTDPGSLQARAARGADGFDAVWVAAGRVTRLFLYHRGKAAGSHVLTPFFGAVVPVSWKPAVFLARGIGVQDAGVKPGKKVWLVSGDVPPSAPVLVASGTWSYDSDLAGLEVRNGRILVRTLDAPRGFTVSSATPVLMRTTTLSPGGTLSVGGDPALRAVDAFMSASYAAKTPTALQRRLKVLASEPPFVQPTVRGMRVVLDGETRLVFTLTKGGGRLHVVGVGSR